MSATSVSGQISGLGGCYGPSNYERRSERLQAYAKRPYTRDEVERLSEARDVDVVLTHDAPAGVHFPRHRGGLGFVSPAAGLDEMLDQLSPSVCFFGHHHTRLDADIRGVRCIGLN